MHWGNSTRTSHKRTGVWSPVSVWLSKWRYSGKKAHRAIWSLRLQDVIEAWCLIEAVPFTWRMNYAAIGRCGVSRINVFHRVVMLGLRCTNKGDDDGKPVDTWQNVAQLYVVKTCTVRVSALSCDCSRSDADCRQYFQFLLPSLPMTPTPFPKTPLNPSSDVVPRPCSIAELSIPCTRVRSPPRCTC